MCFMAHQGNPIPTQCSAQLKDNICLSFDIMVVTTLLHTSSGTPNLFAGLCVTALLKRLGPSSL